MPPALDARHQVTSCGAPQRGGHQVMAQRQRVARLRVAGDAPVAVDVLADERVTYGSCPALEPTVVVSEGARHRRGGVDGVGQDGRGKQVLGSDLVTKPVAV